MILAVPGLFLFRFNTADQYIRGMWAAQRKRIQRKKTGFQIFYFIALDDLSQLRRTFQNIPSLGEDSNDTEASNNSGCVNPLHQSEK